MITLKTLPDATEQEVFDQVAIHMLTQNERSQSDDLANGGCKYRLGELKCAAGCLIGDDEYLPRMDTGIDMSNGTGWAELIEAGLVPVTHKTIINNLQALHDSQPVSLWFDKLVEFAGKHNLNPYDVIKFKGVMT